MLKRISATTNTPFLFADNAEENESAQIRGICGSQNTSSGCQMHEAICNKKPIFRLAKMGEK
jgi:hypothetical protein